MGESPAQAVRHSHHTTSKGRDRGAGPIEAEQKAVARIVELRRGDCFLP